VLALLDGRATRVRGPYARRLVDTWRRRPSADLVRAVDTALVVVADHELATTTLAVRVAASLRTSPYLAFAAGLASTAGTINSAAAEAHRLIEASRRVGAATEISGRRAGRGVLPGFGHTVYRRMDPRFPILLEAVRHVDPAVGQAVDAIVTEVGRVLSHPPNVDLALGALTVAGGLPPACPLVAVARLAGWGAHFDEEVGERPIRFRGAATER
jgi:citrate synthase